MTPAVDGGLAVTAADDGVAATTTTSHLQAAAVERVMATMADSGVAATTATSRLQAVTAERAMALAFDGGVVAMAADGGVVATAASNSCRRAAAVERVVGVPRTPNRDATRTTLRGGLCRRRDVASQLELSSNDSGLAEQR
jgi:hypothetical protein